MFKKLSINIRLISVILEYCFCSENLENMGMPLRHQATKIHKEFYFNKFCFVHLSVLVPWWQKYYFSE
jgi:hypothetical protein